MSACATCGKCPCYEHERKTVAMNPDPKAHESRMAELQQRWMWHNPPQNVFAEALAYADELAAKLEAERSKVAEMEIDAVRLDSLCHGHLDELAQTQEKLRATERVIGCVRDLDDAPLLAGLLAAEKLDRERSDRAGEKLVALTEALSAYDAINQGSRGGARC